MRDRVLQNAEIREADVVLDVGAGNGLIGFAALDRAGESGRVIFSDISEELLADCREIAETLDVVDRCDFVLASTDDLHPLNDGAVDVVMTRSVLIYVDDKRRAFQEFFRVLRLGGRLSIFEPINRFGYPEPAGLYRGLDVSPVAELAVRVKNVGISPSEHPLLAFDERDLLRFAEEAGFSEIRLDYSASVSVGPHWAAEIGWETYKRMASNPLDPTVEESMNDALSAEEKETFEHHVRAVLESGAVVTKKAARAYLCAVKTTP